MYVFIWTINYILRTSPGVPSEIYSCAHVYIPYPFQWYSLCSRCRCIRFICTGHICICRWLSDFMQCVLRVQQMKWKYFPLYYSSNRFDWLYRCSQFWQTQLMALELLLVRRVGWFGGVLFSFLLRFNIDKYFWIDSRSDAIALHHRMLP